MFHLGSVAATVAALPSPSTSGRLLLLLKSISEDMDSSSSKRAKKNSGHSIGSLVEAEVGICASFTFTKTNLKNIVLFLSHHCYQFSDY